MEKITNEIEAMVAVVKDGNALRFVAHEIKTAEICLAAVDQQVYSFKYVPKEHKTAELEPVLKIV